MLPLSNRRVHGTANPGAHGHTVALSQWADGFDGLGWEANGDMPRERSLTAPVRLAGRGLTVRRVVVMLECFRVA